MPADVIPIRPQSSESIKSAVFRLIMQQAEEQRFGKKIEGERTVEVTSDLVDCVLQANIDADKLSTVLLEAFHAAEGLIKESPSPLYVDFEIDATAQYEAISDEINLLIATDSESGKKEAIN